MSGASSTRYRIDDLLIDVGRRAVLRGTSSIHLPRLSFDLLKTLIEAAPNLVSNEQLARAVWRKVIVTPETVTQRVKLLRDALGDDPGAPRYIAGLRGQGYRVLPPVTVDPETIIATPANGPANVTKRKRSRIISITAVAAALGTALTYLLIDQFFAVRHGESNIVRAASQPLSIAVLPLANQTGDTTQQYFTDGLSEDLITALSQLPGLKVIGRASSFQFRDFREDSKSIGSKLGVARLLEGSVRRAGDVIRVTVELVDTSDGSTQWTERYDRPYKDLFALENDITRSVALALRAKLLPGELALAQSERPPSGSLDAYNALLQGMFFHFRTTEADYRKAIEFYTKATELDPRYAFAYSRLSRAWSTIAAVYLDGALAREAFVKARAASDRALALSPELAAAHNARGDLLELAAFDWRGAEAEYRRAMELVPNEAEAKLHVAQLLAMSGKVEPAIELTRQALTTDPLQGYGYAWLADYLLSLDRLDEAERAIGKAIELQPAAAFRYERLASIEVRRGDGRAALAAARQEPPGPRHDFAVALALQLGPDRGAADAALRTLIDKDTNGSAFEIAEIYALRDDANATFEWLDRAWSNRENNVGALLFDRFILRFQDDPRLAAFCRKVGLPVPMAAKRK